MENLKIPIRRVLLNSIDYSKVGAYYDTVAGVNILSFKEYGINIPYVSTSFKGAKACTFNGAVESEEIELNPLCGCSSCDWEYGVTFTKKVKNPGVNNNETNYKSKSYTGTIAKVTCTSGYIDDVWKLMAEDDIITQIFEDTGLHNTNTDPVFNSGAIVEARRVYKFTVTNAVTDTLDITPGATGVTTTVTLSTTVQLSCDAINGTAAINPYVFAVAEDATHIILYSKNNGDLFTAAIGGTTASVDYRRIWFTSKSPYVSFGLSYDKGFATTYKRSLWVLDATGVAADATKGISIYVNGTQANSADKASVALEVAGIQALTALGIYAVAGVGATANYIYVMGNSTVDSLYISFSAYPGANPTVFINPTVLKPATGIYPMTPTGSYPKITGADIFALMANEADSGMLATWVSVDKPDPTADYCMYMFRYSQDIFAIHGASHNDHIESYVEVYVKKSIINTAFLYPVANATALTGQAASLNDAPATTATVDLEELLQLWAGTGTIAQATGIVTGGSSPNSWTN